MPQLQGFAKAKLASHLLALFVFTLGAKVSQKITDLFAAKSFALGAMLDAVASQGTDVAAVKAANPSLPAGSS